MFNHHHHRSTRCSSLIASFATISLLVLLQLGAQEANGVQLGMWEKKYEGESGDEYFDVDKVDGNPTTYSGYTGRGFADFGGRGSFVQWNVETISERTEYTIAIRYSAPNQRNCDIYIDDVKRGNYSISSTGSWNKWEDSNSVKVSLDKGVHKIKLIAAGDSGPNVDFLQIRAIEEITVIDHKDEPEEMRTTKENISQTLEGDKMPIEETGAVLGLEKDSSLPRGRYISSPKGSYVMGLVESTGELVIKSKSNDVITWSNGVLGGERLYMQADGNLVVRKDDSSAIWNTLSGRNTGAELQLEIDDNGVASIVSGSYKFWRSPEPMTASFNSGGNIASTNNEKRLFSGNPNFMRFNERVVLKSLENLSRGKFISSPSNMYHVGLNDVGDFVLQDTSNKRKIWNANVTDCATATMQPDGNFVLRDRSNKLIWTTHTSGNPGARLVVDNGGRLSIMVGQTTIWMEGIPRGVYNGAPSSSSLQFPLRGIFYYPWYPETWSVNSKPVKFVPDLGTYSSDDASIVEEHIDSMEYAYSDIAIASWWGPGTSQELSRISLLMDKTFEMKSSIKWTVYYEGEMFRNPSMDKIKSDLDYLRKWFVWHPTWAFIKGKPVIFVYNEAGCSVNERWVKAAGNDWYVVLKVFPGYKDCTFQPDSYHQYGPSNEYIHIEGVSTSVSPGFWRADMEEPKLPRLSKERFCENTKKMVESGEDWQLITTFNEAGEGTLVEASSDHWGSDTKYGFYLDCLNEHTTDGD